MTTKRLVREHGLMCFDCNERLGDHKPTRRLCSRCYTRRIRARTVPPVTLPLLIERFRRTTASGCWEWLGPVSPAGYGRWSTGYMHRLAYELLVGPIPAGNVLDHLCRNTICFNPAHLDPTEHRENVLRGKSPSVVLYLKGVCQRGHQMTPDNVYVRPGNGHRMCRACQRLRRHGAHKKMKVVTS